MATPIPSTAGLLELMKAMSPAERAQLDAFLLSVDPAIWVPQTLAYHSPADIVFYGGSAGGGKTDLLLGLALTAQDHSIVFRREAVQLIGLEERMTNILGSRDGYNGRDHLWLLPGKKVLEFGSVQKPSDWVKYQGRAHDAKLFDEITHFTEMHFRTLIGWMRTDNPKVRKRVVRAGNPLTARARLGFRRTPAAHSRRTCSMAPATWPSCATPTSCRTSLRTWRSTSVCATARQATTRCARARYWTRCKSATKRQ